MQRYCCYYRVSTRQQGQSGLGLEAQREAALRFAESRGGEVAAEYTEVESGRAASRPQLAAAIRFCRMTRSTLLIARLDRLARNVRFVADLLESDVKFVCADSPDMSHLTIHIMAAVAQEEHRLISERNRQAAAARRARGLPMGIHATKDREGTRPARRERWLRHIVKAREAKDRLTTERYREIGPKVRELRDGGMSSEKIAAWMNQQGWRGVRGGKFSQSTVDLILSRYPSPTKKETG